jgi:alkanesulfonate monooxygenase SsuD/methylene tetrahydromethanopterin reductase-like flavin-dependent oxidoreductase (luciferase family)
MLDQDANRELFEEQVEIIFEAFNERAFSHQGNRYTIPPAAPRGASHPNPSRPSVKWARQATESHDLLFRAC